MTLRWFGTGYDSVTLEQIRQIPGVTGVITTLYNTKPGEVWSRDDIHKLKAEVEAAGLKIAGIESVNVCDAIKVGTPDRDMYIDNYIQTLEHLGEEDIHLVVYNFMPVFDWTRTELARVRPDGSTVLAYNQDVIDKLDPNYYTEIENVVEFSGKINLNYDCLRAICFELNHGLSFSEAIKDLNIVNIEPESYKIVLQFDNGESVHNNSVEIDMFEFEEQKYFYMYSKSEEYIGNVSFIPGQAIYDYKTGVYTIPGNKINFNFDDIDEYAFHTRPVVKTLEKCKPQQLLIIKAKIKPIHYTV